jgi:hypothetical protein
LPATQTRAALFARFDRLDEASGNGSLESSKTCSYFGMADNAFPNFRPAFRPSLLYLVEKLVDDAVQLDLTPSRFAAEAA